MWLRLRQICLVARQLEPVVDDLRSVFGLEIAYRDPAVGYYGLENALLPVGNQFLEVVAPIQEQTAGERYLEKRGGDGGYMVITQCDDHGPRRRRIEKLGIRLASQFELKGFQHMQLHPKDTGGSFFEIDCQTDGLEPDGPWEPAGTDWWQARRLDVVRAISAAEIQSPEPRRVAERWSEISEIPLEAEERGRISLPLENARLRFVEPSDGRPEGLGGVDLAAVDRQRALAAAEERGLRSQDDVILICGTRFRLHD